MKIMKISQVPGEYDLDEFWMDKLEQIIQAKYPNFWDSYETFFVCNYDTVAYQLNTDNLPDELRPPFQEAVDWLNENKDKYYLPDVDKFIL